MSISIDPTNGTLTVDGKVLDLYSRESFEVISDIWLKVGWAQKYSYSFSWAGVPIIQLPEDVLRYQEHIWRLRPDVIVETGVAHGGSVVCSASLCRMMGNGRVIGIDIDIRPHNLSRIQSHPFADLITLLQGSSTDPSIVNAVRDSIDVGQSVLVVLDSDHSYSHVLNELRAYAPIVTPGSYIIATDGIMRDLGDVPGGKPTWRSDNPARAAADFLAENDDFVLEEPPWPFNESQLRKRITYWPDAYLKRIK